MALPGRRSDRLAGGDRATVMSPALTAALGKVFDRSPLNHTPNDLIRRRCRSILSVPARAGPVGSSAKHAGGDKDLIDGC